MVRFQISLLRISVTAESFITEQVKQFASYIRCNCEAKAKWDQLIVLEFECRRATLKQYVMTAKTPEPP